jgi:SRI (Set2 Rpb1 interacting) domain
MLNCMGFVQIAKHIVACLGPYRRPDCEQGRINTTEEFKQLARKVGHTFWFLTLQFHALVEYCVNIY